MAKTLKLLSPPGYGSVSPLDRQAHRGMGLPAASAHAWSRTLNAAPINAVEFFRAALDYPIAFARDGKGSEFMPVAVLGLRSGQNLYVDALGRWRSPAYVPAYVRRYPFCIADLPPKKGENEKQRLVCVEDGALTADSPQPLFTVNGEPTPAWAPIHQLLEAMEGARLQTRVLTRRLEALDLLVPFEAVAMPRKGARTQLRGLYRVDEERLAGLQGKDFRTLLKKGELRAIYAHLLSLENFGRLLDLSQAAEASSAS